MSDRHWVIITDFTEIIGCCLSIFSNSVLLFLIFRKTSPIKGAYKQLLIFYCIFTVFYSGVETLLCPLIHLYDNTLYLIQRKRFDVSKVVTRLISTSYCWCYAMSFTLFAVQFVYRYIAVCKPHRIDWFAGRKFFYWIFGMCASATSWSAAAFYLFPPTERTDKSFLHVIESSYKLDPYWTDYVGYKYFDTDENNVRSVNLLSFLGVVQHFIIMVVTFGILVYCGVKTYSSMKNQTRASIKTRKLQDQLFKALVAQTFVPTVLMYVPIGFMFGCPYLDLQLGSVTNYQTVMAQLYPGIDPLILIALIDFYRRTLIGLIFPRFLTATRRKSYAASSGSSNINLFRRRRIVFAIENANEI